MQLRQRWRLRLKLSLNGLGHRLRYRLRYRLRSLNYGLLSVLSVLLQMALIKRQV